MPYSVNGKVVINRQTGKRRVFGSAKKARNWVHFNNAREHGFTPTGFRSKAAK